MSLILQKGFTKSLVMTMVSEFGDRTFCVAAILAMRHPRGSVFFGCMFSVIVMTVLSAFVGWTAPNLISKDLAHNITTLLFFVFGIWSLWDAYNEDDDDNDELVKVEKELDKPSSTSKPRTDNDNKDDRDKDDEDLKKKKTIFLRKIFSPVFLKAFSVTFFGEWGDKSQIATIGLAADEDILGVILGGILGQAICTVAAVVGGRSLASRVSERLVTFLGGVLFLVFGVQSFLSSSN